MREHAREIWVDIGGGDGEHFTRLAKKDPRKSFVVVEPAIRRELLSKLQLENTNLHFVKGEVSTKSHLPFTTGGVDHVECHFLYGEIPHVWGDADLEYEGYKKDYLRLLKEIKRILKNGGTLVISDSKRTIPKIHTLIEGLKGFKINSCTPWREEPRTTWANILAKGSPENNIAYPYLLKATKSRPLTP